MPGELFRFREFELDRSAFELRRDGQSVHLERIPLELLCLLVERNGRLVTREEIIASIWGKDVYLDTEHAINTAVRKIRQALKDDPEAPRFVLTVPAKGYRFVAPVEIPKPTVGAVGLEKAPLVAGPHKKNYSGILIPSVLFLLAIGVAAFFYFHRVQALTEKDTVVLADFANSTGDAVFDDTLKQALSVELSQSPFLNILSDQKVAETLQMMGHPSDQRVNEKTAMDICLRTQSAAVVAGSIVTLGSQYVIGLNAVACPTGENLLQEQLRAGSKEEVLQAVDRAATKLRGRLGESLSMIRKFDLPIEQATTSSLEALQAFSLGRKALTVKADFTGSVPLFQRAISLDPNFAAAYASLGAAYSNLGQEDLAAINFQKAYELRDRVTTQEKFHIETEYYDTVTGELEKSLQVCELWKLAYPRDFLPYFITGNNEDTLGRYEEALVEARESHRLNPDDGLTNAYLAFAYQTVGQLGQVETTVREAQAKNLDTPPLHFTLYFLAFERNDSEAMARELKWAAGKPGVEDVMIAAEAGSFAYHGQLSKSRELSQRAVESAERAGEKETAAGYEADAALREALLGNKGRVLKWALSALEGSPDRAVQFAATLATAIAGDTARAETLAANLGKRFPLDTIVKFSLWPTIQAQIAINRNNPAQAVEALQAAAPYELGGLGAGGFGVALYAVYVRGQAYLASNQGTEAVTEFQKILDHRGIVGNEIIGALAHLGMGRAYALQGQSAKARAAYQDFFTLWKGADPDIPILLTAKAEYAKLR